MLDTLPHLTNSHFPAIRRGKVSTLQVNLGYLCNQQCLHCHVNAGPKRTEQMTAETAADVLDYLRAATGIATLDLTGGAPELNSEFRNLVVGARRLGKQVMDRCNLTVLSEPRQEDLADFLAAWDVKIVASLPCYTAGNVEQQRGKGVFDRSIEALRRLNERGYGRPDSGLDLDLVYNPLGPVLPPPQQALQSAYRERLFNDHGVVFNRLYTLTNMPIQRFGSTLLSQGKFDDYLQMLRNAHQDSNLDAVMCRSLISVDWQGYVYDCDFNQMLKLPLRHHGRRKTHISQLIDANLDGNPIVVMDHCYGCTAGQGSSCGGALS